jgi:hypothetical protein
MVKQVNESKKTELQVTTITALSVTEWHKCTYFFNINFHIIDDHFSLITDKEWMKSCHRDQFCNQRTNCKQLGLVNTHQAGKCSER